MLSPKHFCKISIADFDELLLYCAETRIELNCLINCKIITAVVMKSSMKAMCFMLNCYLAHFSTLKMEVIASKTRLHDVRPSGLKESVG
jgi:hypothetical protein